MKAGLCKRHRSGSNHSEGFPLRKLQGGYQKSSNLSRGPLRNLRRSPRDKPVYVPHLTAWPRLGFAIKVKDDVRFRRKACIIQDLGSEQIGHLDITVAVRDGKRPAGDRPNVQLKLRDLTGILGPMTGIVDARSNFINQKRFG